MLRCAVFTIEMREVCDGFEGSHASGSRCLIARTCCIASHPRNGLQRAINGLFSWDTLNIHQQS